MDSEVEQYQHVCRTCLSKKENMKSIFNIADILMSCTPIQIEQGDGLPTKICTDCALQANQAYEFRLLCEQSDNVLRKKNIKQHFLIKTDGSETSPETYTENECSLEIRSEEKVVPLKIERVGDSLTTVQNNLVENVRRNGRHKKSTKKNSTKDAQKTEQCKNENTKELEKETEERTNSDNDDLGDDLDVVDPETELSCRYCDMKFRYKVRLKKHEQKHLHGLKCHLCEKDFSTIKQLTNHINIHSRKGAHLCQTCGKQFTLPENLVRHQRIHTGIRPYKCHLCNKSFTQSNELKSHLVTHSSEKHHLCSVCGNKYSRSISLRVHMRRIHSIPPNHRPYICAVCGRNFKDRRDLSQHMLIHTGERSHVCKVCGKAFNRSSNLRVHERIHTGHKPHVCPVCQRAFIQKHVLNTHMRTHPLPHSLSKTVSSIAVNVNAE